MKTAYFKDSIRKLKSSIFQYISIILIIILGVAFFVGMNVISPNMNHTAEDYLKNSKIYDICLVSTIGFEDEDIQKIKSLDYVKTAEAIYTQDVILKSDEITLATRLNSIPEEDMNKINLTEGRMPEKKSECVIDTRLHTMYGYNIGDEIEIKTGTDKKIKDLVNVSKFTIVGIGRNPTYLSQYYGSTSLETGELKGLLMVKKEIFELDYYTAIYVKTFAGEKYNYFADEDVYKSEMEQIGGKLLDELVPNAKKRCNELYSDSKEEIKDAEKELNENEKKLADFEKKLEDSEKQLKEQEDIWNEVKKQYKVNMILNPGTVMAVNMDIIDAAFESLDEAREELDSKKEEYESEKEDYEKDIEDSKQKLDDAKYLVDNFSVDLYQNNLAKNDTFIALKNDLVKIGMMGKVFPLMFFIVAALVTVTTVSRTIEEERGNIGILKALGYGNFTIAKKFIIYSFLTTVIGTVLGVIVGNSVILKILYDSYSSLYAIPDLINEINWPYVILVVALSSVSIIGVTIFIVVKALKEKASELMRPKSAKDGKNIYLEKVGFLWKHFNFFYKSSFRNIFRYKRRLIMALIGIAGCTALIYTGFSLKASIDSTASRQFSKIKTYDMEVNLKNELPKSKLEDAKEYIKNLEDVKDIAEVRQQATTMWAGDKFKDLYYVVIDKGEINKFVNLKDRISGENVKLNTKGIIITEKISKELGIKVGDKVKIGDDVKANEVKVTGITENYLYNFIYITPELYEEVYEQEVKYNQFFLNTDGLEADEMDDLVEDIKDNDKISGVMLTANADKEYKTSLNGLMTIVFLFIGCASILSFIVLVNLNIINISERKRELATLKVLGFFEKEVSSYVFRENVILTIMGILVGMILGNFVLGIIIKSAEVDTIMLPNELSYESLGYAAILTIVFTLVTNFVMNSRIKKIDMIDSLKSVE